MFKRYGTLNTGFFYDPVVSHESGNLKCNKELGIFSVKEHIEEHIR